MSVKMACQCQKYINEEIVPAIDSIKTEFSQKDIMKMTLGYLGVLKELLNTIKYVSRALAHILTNDDDERKKGYAALSLAKKSGKLVLDQMAKEKKTFTIYYEDFAKRFIDFANNLYTYYEKIAKGVDFTSMDIDYTGPSFLAENYIEKKDANAFEFN